MTAYKQHFEEQEKYVIGQVWTETSRMPSQAANQKEPLMSSPVPTGLWEAIATDLF